MSELDNLIAGLPGAVEAGLDAAAADAAAFAASKVTRRTANGLGDSIFVKHTASFAREIYADKFYADYVENGRRGFSMGDKVLRFEINGRVVFARSVGPAAPRPFMAPARVHLEEVGPKHLDRAIARMAGT